MFCKLKNIMKSEIHLKNVLMWFVSSFIVVFFIMIMILQQSVNIYTLIEIFGFSAIFVLMMGGTKVYSLFIENYYESLIHRLKK